MGKKEIAMLGNMKIKAKLFTGFGVVIALALVVAVASILSMPRSFFRS